MRIARSRFLILVATLFVAFSCEAFAQVTPSDSRAVQLERVASGLDTPLYVTGAPGEDNTLYVVERGGVNSDMTIRPGEIKALDLDNNTLRGTPVLSLTGLGTGNEQGLLGLAFDPNYASNRYFYVNAVVENGTNDRTEIRRYTMNASGTADLSTQTTIMQFDQPFGNHNGGWMGFSPNDGYLYIGSGDGGSAYDPQENGQSLSTPLGKILRIDPSVDGFAGDPNRNYSIPSTNPFVGNTAADPEIWAYGLRNPFRNSFDRVTGDLIIGDVGQDLREEINFQPADSLGGENYGWLVREGTIETPDVGGDKEPGMIDPIYDYAHGNGDFEGRSVTGGYVYRGPNPELQGKYIFADYVSQNVWAFEIEAGNPLEFDGTNFSDLELLTFDDSFNVNSISSFGEDNNGNLYLVDFDGEIFRIASVPEPSGVVLVALAWREQ